MSEERFDTYRESVLGRADVEDTPELVKYYQDLTQFEAGALWTVANKIEPWEPKSDSVPVVWRYRDLRDYVLRSVDLVTPEKAGRRVIYLNNPGRQDVSAAVGWLYSGLQVMNPGEAASAHAHSSSALRFIMEGRGAYTIVDGHTMTLGANDFVLTPNRCWHEHGVEADGLPCYVIINTTGGTHPGEIGRVMQANAIPCGASVLVHRASPLLLCGDK